MALKPKSIAKGLAFLEFCLWISVLLGINIAKSATEEKGLLVFLVWAAWAAVIPATLAMLCEGMRYFLNKEIENENV